MFDDTWYEWFSVYLVEECDRFLRDFIVEILKESKNNDEIESYKVYEIYDALCASNNENMDMMRYKKDIDGLLAQMVLKADLDYMEAKYFFNDKPFTIFNFIINFMKEVEVFKLIIKSE